MTFPEPPSTVNVSGRDFPIETDFRASVAFELLASDPDVSLEDLAFGILDTYFPWYAGKFRECKQTAGPDLVFLALHATEAIKALLGFYEGGMPKGKGTGGNRKRLYDFEADEPYIYASFLQAYQIDLRQAKLHWWNFKALLSALPEETIFERILHIRAVEITSKMSKEEKDRYRRLKKLYALPDKRSQAEQEEDEALRAVLMGSGDLSELEVTPHG